MNESSHQKSAPTPDLIDTKELSLLLKAMGHPSRLSLIEHLSQNEQCCGGDFCECMGLAQSTISQHLELLKEAGLVDVTTCGTKSIFKLNRKKLFALGQSLQAISKCKCANSNC